jgi:hypothetical protein
MINPSGMGEAHGGSLITVGIDLGQKSDPTAIVICEELVDLIEEKVSTGIGGATTAKYERGTKPSRWIARTVQRLPLNTPYPKVAEIVASIISELHTRHRAAVIENPWPSAPAYADIRVIVDSTGVGIPVVELIREALKPYKVSVVAATFTYGRNLNQHSQSQWTVGKAFLVGRLQALLQDGRIKMPDTRETRALADELEHYEIKISDAGSDTYGAFKTGTHDDLATALGLAVLLDTPAPNRIIRRPPARRRHFA